MDNVENFIVITVILVSHVRERAQSAVCLNQRERKKQTAGEICIWIGVHQMDYQ
jgi:hypothetical protein